MANNHIGKMQLQIFSRFQFWDLYFFQYTSMVHLKALQKFYSNPKRFADYLPYFLSSKILAYRKTS